MQKKSFKEWFFATRPWSLPASSMSVVVSTMFLWWTCSHSTLDIDWPNAALALLGIMLFHLGGNLLSDYHDFVSGVDRPGDESIDTLTSGRFAKGEILRFSIVLLAIGCLVGLLLTLRSGWPLLIIGGAGLLLSLFYYYLKYHALGDFCIFLNFGILPTLGTAYVATGALHWPVLLIAVIVGPVTIAILHANNARDVKSDGAADTKTFAMLIGPKASQIVYGVETLGPHLIILAAIVLGWFPWTAVAAFLALPTAIKLNREVAAMMDSDLPFSGIDQKTAQLQLQFGLLLAAGFAIAAIVL